MTISFKCPQCKKALKVAEQMAGKKATCPQCKTSIRIPTPAPTPAVQAETPPIDVDAIAAAALHDEPVNGTKVEVTDTIDFKCEFCEHEIHVPRADAGKRMQCPNPECRSIIKVPAPKDGPKKLPTVAQLTQVEKIDEAAWGTQTDKTHVHKESFKEAGALPPVQHRPIGPREWIQRGLIAVAVLAGVALAAYGMFHVNQVQRTKGFVETALLYVEPPKGADEKDKVNDPVARAEVYRAIALYRAHRPEKKRDDLLGAINKALASVQLRQGMVPSVERDLFLGDLALTATELGGTELEDRGKEKFEWKGNDVPQMLTKIIHAIHAPEARIIALRALTTRLLELEQPEIALQMAQLGGADSKGAPPPTSQRVVMLLWKDQPMDKRVKVPDGKSVPDPVARTGYAEFHARKGNLDEAKKLALDRRGPVQDRLDACVGVADVLLQTKTAGAEEFVDEALTVVKAQADAKRLSPWLVLQTIRLGAHVRGPDAVRDLVKKLPESFQPCGYLEVLVAEADRNSQSALGTIALSDIRDAKADSPSLYLGWEALARQNARVGGSSEVDAMLTEDANRRYRAMVHIGRGLSGVTK